MPAHLRYSVACSNAYASLIRRPSSHGRARNCSPAGSGERAVSSIHPIGTVIAGAPVGGAICGELLPGAVRTQEHQLVRGDKCNGGAPGACMADEGIQGELL